MISGMVLSEGGLSMPINQRPLRNEGVIFDWAGTLWNKSTKRLIPPANNVLEELYHRGYHLSLISLAKDGRSYEESVLLRQKEIESSGIVNYFEEVIVGVQKDKSQFLKCMETMGTIPQNTFVVDDRTVRGIKIGNQLGCRTLWISQGEYAHEFPNKETGQPTKVISSVEDLLGVLK